MKIAKASIILLLYLIILCCSGVNRISNANLIYIEDGRKVPMSEEKIEKLNLLMDKGITRILGSKKWQVGNYIEAKLSSRENLDIYSFEGGYIKTRSSLHYYEVKPDYMDMFYEIFEKPSHW